MQKYALYEKDQYSAWSKVKKDYDKKLKFSINYKISGNYT